MAFLWRTAFAALWLALASFPTGGMAQVEAERKEYRELLALCFDSDDFLCAFDVLMEHGELEGMPPVAVSVEGGPTVFGSLMFAIIDRAKERLDPDIRRSMAEQAISYIFDAQPDQPYAVGPFMLLYGEICREQEDRRCVLTAGQSVELFLEQDVWYFRGSDAAEGASDVRARAVAFVQYFKGLLE